MNKRSNISVQGFEVSVVDQEDQDFISLTDIAKKKDDRTDQVLQNWIRSRQTIEFLGTWESIHNQDFNYLEFEGFKNSSGANSFVLTPKQWIEKTKAIGIVSKAGRYGGTYAHKDIAFEFASWISPAFKLYLIKEFQRLKEDEILRLEQGWDIKRMIAKANYRIQTDAIKNHLIQAQQGAKQRFVYANEADMLNVIIWGKTASEWERENPNLKGNVRDHAAVEELVVLSNMESFNAQFIKEGISPEKRFEKLTDIMRTQMETLLKSKSIKKLDKKSPPSIEEEKN
ncbi:MAG: KilA-N domain-containing protein [Candidatus Melainabacteria bacterium]|jgi:hypothetical protein